MYLINLIILLYVAHADCKLFPIAVRLPLNGTPPDLGGSLWPRPNFQQFTTETFFIGKNLKLDLDSFLNVCERDILEKLWDHYQNIFYPSKLDYQTPESTEPVLKSIYFQLTSASAPILFSSSCSESYYPFIQDTQTESCNFFNLV